MLPASVHDAGTKGVAVLLQGRLRLLQTEDGFLAAQTMTLQWASAEEILELDKRSMNYQKTCQPSRASRQASVKHGLTRNFLISLFPPSVFFGLRLSRARGGRGRAFSRKAQKGSTPL